MKQKAGLWLCRGTERRAHHNTELQNRAAIQTHNSPSPLKSISSSQSYIPSVHFHPGRKYFRLQTTWTHDSSLQQTGSSERQAWALPYSCVCRRLWRCRTPTSRGRRCQILQAISEQRQTMPDPPGRAQAGLALLLLPLCTQPLSQGWETQTDISLQTGTEAIPLPDKLHLYH